MQRIKAFVEDTRREVERLFLASEELSREECSLEDAIDTLTEQIEELKGKRAKLREEKAVLVVRKSQIGEELRVNKAFVDVNSPLVDQPKPFLTTPSGTVSDAESVGSSRSSLRSLDSEDPLDKASSSFWRVSKEGTTSRCKCGGTWENNNISSHCNKSKDHKGYVEKQKGSK